MENGDIEFLAEKEHITITSKLNCAKLHLISGDVGPFHVGMPLDVPIWLALALKFRNKCQIHCPDWLTVENLEQIKEDETNNELFTPLPNPFYREISNLLLNQSSGDIPNADQVQTLIKDIWDIRISKLRSSVDKFIKVNAQHARLDNLTQLEINTMRTFLTAALNQRHALEVSQNLVSRNFPSSSKF